MTRTSLPVSLGSLVVFAGVASAQPPEGAPAWQERDIHSHPWEVTPLVGTTVGQDLAAGVQLETPLRLRFMATAGWMPNGYAWGLGEYYQAFNPSSERVGDLLQDLYKFSFVFGANMTFRPMPRRGFFFGGGYSLQYASKSGLVAGQIELGTDTMLPPSEVGQLRLFETSTTLQSMSGMAGWEWGIGDGFMMRAALGVIVPFHSSTDLTPQFVPMDPGLVDQFTTTASERLEDAGTWLIVPTGSLHLGYVFY